MSLIFFNFFHSTLIKQDIHVLFCVVTLGMSGGGLQGVIFLNLPHSPLVENYVFNISTTHRIYYMITHSEDDRALCDMAKSRVLYSLADHILLTNQPALLNEAFNWDPKVCEGFTS